MNLRTTFHLIFFLLCTCPVFPKNRITKIACIGNSITYGHGIPNREQNSYPAQLQAFLGERYEVRNFGVSGRTMLRKGDYPYMKTGAFREALDYRPDIVLIKLGTNDSKPHNWVYKTEFTADYQALIDSFLNRKTVPRIILLTPIRCFLPDENSINTKVIEKEICPMIEDLAKRNHLEIISLTELFGETWDSSLVPDKIHPSSIGAGMMARKIGCYLAKLSTTNKQWNECTHAIPGNEFRPGAGWVAGNEWHSVATDIRETLAGKHLKLLLLGNSITQGWGGTRKAITHKPGKQAMDELLGEGNWESAGISGDRTQNLLWRLRKDNYNCCVPANVVIAIGINNLIAGGNTPEEVTEGLIAVTDEACRQFPASRIFLLGILPAGKEKTSAIRQKCDRTHDLLAGHSFRRASYVNLTSCFLAPDGSIQSGLYSSDYIHLTEQGYKVLAKEIADLIQDKSEDVH